MKDILQKRQILSMGYDWSFIGLVRTCLSLSHYRFSGSYPHAQEGHRDSCVRLHHRIVKLPAHRAGLPGNEISFFIVSLDPLGLSTPPTRRGLRGTCRSKEYPEKPSLVTFNGPKQYMEECKGLIELAGVPPFPDIEQPFKTFSILARCHMAMNRPWEFDRRYASSY